MLFMFDTGPEFYKVEQNSIKKFKMIHKVTKTLTTLKSENKVSEWDLICSCKLIHNDRDLQNVLLTLRYFLLILARNMPCS